MSQAPQFDDTEHVQIPTEEFLKYIQVSMRTCTNNVRTTMDTILEQMLNHQFLIYANQQKLLEKQTATM